MFELAIVLIEAIDRAAADASAQHPHKPEPHGALDESAAK
jgi:hypothetical protein